MSLQHDPPDLYLPHCKCKHRPAVNVPLMVALSTHVGICWLEVQQAESIVDMNLSQAPVAGHADMQACFLPGEAHPSELPEGEGILLMENMILSFLEVRRLRELLGRAGV